MTPLGFEMINDQLRERAKVQGIPILGSFELTGRCNFNCKMCYVHVKNSCENLKKELTTQELLTIMGNACDMGLVYATLTGGECLLRQDFAELYSFLVYHGVRVTVKTNGLLISDKQIDLFKKLPPKEISVSFYGSNDDVYERVTGCRSFKTVSDNLLRVKSAGLPLKISLTPCKYSVEDIPNIVSFLIENGLKYSISPFLIPPRGEIERDNYYISQEEQLDMLLNIKKLNAKQVVSIDESLLPPIGSTSNEIYNGFDCSAGNYRFCVTWDGFMVPCLSLEQQRIDLRENSFEDAWNLVRSYSQTVVQPVECAGCAYKKVCIRCPVCRYNDLFSGHCNPDVCRFTYEKVKRGLVKV